MKAAADAVIWLNRDDVIVSTHAAIDVVLMSV